MSYLLNRKYNNSLLLNCDIFEVNLNDNAYADTIDYLSWQTGESLKPNWIKAIPVLVSLDNLYRKFNLFELCTAHKRVPLSVSHIPTSRGNI